MTKADFNPDGSQRIIVNDQSQIMTAKARGDPILDKKQADRLLKILDARAGTQAGKPRSQKPDQNPLGARIFDMNCGWKMHRIPHHDSFCYKCGLYMQSQLPKRQCHHNWVDGPTATKVGMAVLRQQVMSPDLIAQLEKNLLDRANVTSLSGRHEKALASRKKELANVRQQLANAKRNAALAESRELFVDISRIYDDLKAREAQLILEISKSETTSQSSDTMKQAIEAAIESLKRFPSQAEDPDNLGAIGELFRSANLEMFLKFHRVQVKNRVLNKLDLGIVTLGNAPSPIQKYNGPTGRGALKAQLQADNNQAESKSPSKAKPNSVPGKQAKSLGKVHHAER